MDKMERDVRNKIFPVKTYCGKWTGGSMEKGEPRFL